MRILFVGAVEFSRHALDEVLKNDGEVVAVLTLARERAGFHSDYADLGELAAEYGVPVHHIKQINEPATIDLIHSLRPDVIFVFGWSQLISQSILEIPPLGCIGTHPALLPRNRGRHPLIWALVEGLTESGLTFFYLDEGADSGDILHQQSFPITLEDDAASLYRQICDLGRAAIREFLPQLKQGTAPRRPQDHSQASYWRKRTAADGQIDWQWPSLKIYNLVRALARPYVGAHTYLAGQPVKIWQTMLPKESLPQTAQAMAPGTVLTISDGRCDIRTGDDYLTIVEYETAGGELITPGIRLETV